MNWKEPRYPLEKGIKDINFKVPKDQKKWNIQKNGIVAQYNSICAYCGGKYDNYLTCFQNEDNIDIKCSLCSDIINLSSHCSNVSYRGGIITSLDNLVLCHTKKSQLKIVRKTVEYYINNNGKTPHFTEIDPDAKILNISFYDICVVMKKNPEILKNFKVFFSVNSKLRSVKNKVVVCAFGDDSDISDDEIMCDGDTILQDDNDKLLPQNIYIMTDEFKNIVKTTIEQ